MKFRMIRSRRIHKTFWLENVKEKEQDLDMDLGKKILKC
jgi:hypothetical protein